MGPFSEGRALPSSFAARLVRRDLAAPVRRPRHPHDERPEGSTTMPMGPTCRSCGRLMWKKVSEKREPQGNTVVYECTNDGCKSYLKGGSRYREKVFEPK